MMFISFQNINLLKQKLLKIIQQINFNQFKHLILLDLYIQLIQLWKVKHIKLKLFNSEVKQNIQLVELDIH